MFNIFKDSLFDPRSLVKYANKKGFFVFFYFLILAILMSAGPIVNIIKQTNSVFTEENTGCSIVDGNLVCDGENYDKENIFYLNGFRVYFLNETDSATDLGDIDFQSVIIQEDSVGIYIGEANLYEINFLSIYDIETIPDLMDSLGNFFLIGWISGVIIQNLVLLLVIVLISSLAFIRFKREIKYRKILKLCIFAVTPLAILFTFYGLFAINEIIFFILMFIAYRPIFTLQREIMNRAALRKFNEQQNQSDFQKQNDDDIVESYKYDEVDSEDIDDQDNDDLD